MKNLKRRDIYFLGGLRYNNPDLCYEAVRDIDNETYLVFLKRLEQKGLITLNRKSSNPIDVDVHLVESRVPQGKMCG
jgi:hypothetical protein